MLLFLFIPIGVRHAKICLRGFILVKTATGLLRWNLETLEIDIRDVILSLWRKAEVLISLCGFVQTYLCLYCSEWLEIVFVMTRLN